MNTPTTEYVVRVLDGDTFETDSSFFSVRLEGVDTPEQGEPKHREAKAALTRLILHKSVRIETKAHGRYHRRIAQVWVNGSSVNHAMAPFNK